MVAVCCGWVSVVGGVSCAVIWVCVALWVCWVGWGGGAVVVGLVLVSGQSGVVWGVAESEWAG